MKYYKGNLHTHTTRSDGHKTPEEALAVYRAAGYDFIALTDHYVFNPASVTEDGMLVISGIEYDTGTDSRDGIYHIVGLGMEAPPLLFNTDKRPPEEIAMKVKEQGGFAMLAHPAWSLNKPSEIERISDASGGFDAVEIYNSVSGLPYSTRPHSGEIVEQLAQDGYIYPLTAVDDTHYYTGDHCQSYVMVHAEELTEKAILDALKRGDFYATQGPEFSWTIEDGVLNVRTTPVTAVFFNSNAVWTPDRITHGEGITEASYQIKPYERWVRFELIDADGKRGWSRVIDLMNNE